MEIILLTRAEDELKYFSKIGDKKTIKKNQRTSNFNSRMTLFRNWKT